MNINLVHIANSESYEKSVYWKPVNHFSHEFPSFQIYVILQVYKQNYRFVNILTIFEGILTVFEGILTILNL